MVRDNRYTYDDLTDDIKDHIETLSKVLDDLRTVAITVQRHGPHKGVPSAASEACFKAVGEVEALRAFWCSRAMDSLMVTRSPVSCDGCAHCGQQDSIEVCLKCKDFDKWVALR